MVAALTGFQKRELFEILQAERKSQELNFDLDCFQRPIKFNNWFTTFNFKDKKR
jgi:hypothetical protein